jgi:4-amino-4-deoxy-L-arabinose transferase-like glycosyltransferase
MIERTLTLPELGLIAGTRVALGVGVGLLLAARLGDEQRRAVGWTLLAVGALTTVPLAANVWLRRDGSSSAARPRPSLSPRWQRREGLIASPG